MFAAVPCVVAMFALQHTDRPTAERPRTPTPEAVAHTLPQLRPAPSAVATPSADAVRATPRVELPPSHAPAGSALPEVVVPDAGLADLTHYDGTNRKLAAKPPAHAAPAKAAGVAETRTALSSPVEPAAYREVVYRGIAAGTFAGDAAVANLLTSADLQRRAGRADLAVADLSRAVALAPGHRAALLGRARVRYDLGDFDGALVDSGRVLELDPGDDGTRFAHAVTLAAAGRHAAARDEFTRLIRREPRRADALAARAECLLALGEPADADADSAAAVALDPADPRARLARARVCLAYGRLEEAFGHCTAGYDAGRNRTSAAEVGAAVELLEILIVWTRPHHSAAQATEYFRWMTVARPDYAPGHARLAGELCDAGQFAAAEAEASAALAIDPRLAVAFYLRGVARGGLGRPAEAQADFVAAARLDPAAPGPRVELARRARAAGRSAEARRLLEEGVERQPAAARLRVLLAADDLARGDLAAAERQATYAAWTAADPADEAAARLVRAAARLLRGEWAGAAADLAALPR